MKTLIDTSVWIDHLHKPIDELNRILVSPENLLLHPFIRGELSLSNSSKSKLLLNELQWFPDIKIASHSEVLDIVNRFHLQGTGIGWVDCHLFASCQIEKVKLFTHDKILRKLAEKYL